MKKIESLTQEQKDLLPVYRDKWMKIGLSTEPADHALAEDALNRAYKVAGLMPPKQIVWVTSPLAGALVVHILKDDKFRDKLKELNIKKPDLSDSVGESVGESVGGSVRDSVRDSVWASVRESVWDSVEDSMRDSVGDSVLGSMRESMRESVVASVRGSVGESVVASVWESVLASVRDSVWESVVASVWESVLASVRDSVDIPYAIYGQHDASWLGFYEYFKDVIKLEKQTEKLIPLMDLSRHSNWVYPYKDIAFMSEKPLEVHLKNGRVHKDGGPCVLYPDGFSVYALDGIRVPDWLTLTQAEELDVNKVMALTNVEHRLLGIKKMGPEKMLKALKSKVISTKGDEYKLHEVEIEGSIEKLLEMKNPSEPKTHFEFVTPEINTVNEALAYRLSLPITLFKEPIAKT